MCAAPETSRSLGGPESSPYFQRQVFQGEVGPNLCSRLPRQMPRRRFEELREQYLRDALLERTKLSLSPYSYLSAQCIIGHVVDDYRMTDDAAVSFAVTSLIEMEFAYR
jgi:hypothetical protein